MLAEAVAPFGLIALAMFAGLLIAVGDSLAAGETFSLGRAIAGMVAGLLVGLGLFGGLA